MLDNSAMAAAIRSAIEESKLTQKGIADSFGVTEQAVSGWLRTGKVDKRKLPKLAQLTGKPLSHFGMGEAAAPVSGPATVHSYVRVQQLDGDADMGDGAVNEDFPDIVRAMDFAPTYIRSVVGFVPPPGRLVLVTGRGDSMIPVINPGESLMVDTGVTAFDGDGIYLLNTGNGQQVKALQDRGDAVYVVSANAGLYPAFPMPPNTVIGGKVYLRNRIDRFN
ncbi:helix-turn-helix transcriptional regulator [Stenotrophomonas sp. GD03993]|uniref:LexA family transcriptional regulator n=1 Tax=Stenotrophomonas TaxID=40323 RepID=UPI0013129CC6|nr:MULTISPECIES: helix-turn-helix transcriptional regulator [Stenotrophomonas]MDH0188162.1 helix-turn-helix transcriptional regulator [Stenotrophomonas sp. GD04051]MDH0463867.1 helix-turn-helix transcriptional regulator [Stenotrophomonas sp. GD03993]MDH0876704.1 helix-turn-helix transcriptional regulator [Stenotrophomonas sp. GD03877]MDH2155644.1 helix-turn-helix transcriptional regulator [Stenotrophomonas sp. GD03657]